MPILCSLTCSALVVALVNSDPSVAEVEKAALAQRRAIVRGAVTFQCKRSLKARPDASYEVSARVWFDGKKSRQDLRRKEAGQGGVPVREVSGVNCEREGCAFLYIQRAPGESLVAVQLDKLDKKRQGEPPGAVRVDPRLVGYVPFPLATLWHHHLEEFLGRPDRENVTLRKSTWKEQECWLIEYSDPQYGKVHTWIAPNLGNNVVRLVIEGTSKDGASWKTTLESTIAQFGSSKVWYPRSYVCESERNGILSDKEEVSVTDVSLNEPIDPKVFTLAGLDLPEGIRVLGTAVKPAAMGKENVWQNGKITERAFRSEPARPAREPKGVRVWPIAFSVIAGCIAALAAWRALVKKAARVAT